jgi:hypothetical protein
MHWYRPPTCVGNGAHRIQNHFAAAHTTKQMRALVRADGDEIMAGLRIIVTFQADGFAVTFLHTVLPSFYRATVGAVIQ